MHGSMVELVLELQVAESPCKLANLEEILS